MSDTPNLKFREDGTILVKGVILSYPHLYEPFSKDGSKGKYSAKFLMPKATHTADAKALKAHIDKMQIEKWKAKQAPTNLFLKDGTLVAKAEGDENYFFISASETAKPKVIDRDRSPIPEEDADAKMYPGAIVNVLINPWMQDNKYGKKVNANLLAVQFVKKGERLAGGRVEVSVDDTFEDVSGAFGDDEAGSDDDGFD